MLYSKLFRGVASFALNVMNYALLMSIYRGLVV